MTKTQQIIGLLITKDYIKKSDRFCEVLKNLMMNDLFALMGEDNTIRDVNEYRPHIKGLLNDLSFLVSGEQIESRHAKKILEDAWKTDFYSWDLAWYLSDTKLLEEATGRGLKDIVLKIVEANPKAIEDIRGGKKQAIGFIVGQVMKEVKGKANPNQIKEEIKNILT